MINEYITKVKGEFDEQLINYGNAYYWDNEGWTDEHAKGLGIADKSIRSFLESSLRGMANKIKVEVSLLYKTESSKVDYRSDTSIETYHEKSAYNHGIADVIALLEDNGK